MKRTLFAAISVMSLIALPVFAFAMSHGDHSGHEKMDHGKMEMKADDHSGHDHSMHEKMDHGEGMMSGMLMLGNVDQDGVRAMAHIKAYDDAAMMKMQKMGMSATHHFMVMFADIASGKPISDGMAAVKVTPEGGEASDAVKLMKMEDGYGADITVQAGKPAKITVGTRIYDEKKRQFEFDFSN